MVMRTPSSASRADEGQSGQDECPPSFPRFSHGCNQSKAEVFIGKCPMPSVSLRRGHPWRPGQPLRQLRRYHTAGRGPGPGDDRSSRRLPGQGAAGPDAGGPGHRVCPQTSITDNDEREHDEGFVCLLAGAGIRGGRAGTRMGGLLRFGSPTEFSELALPCLCSRPHAISPCTIGKTIGRDRATCSTSTRWLRLPDAVLTEPLTAG